MDDIEINGSFVDISSNMFKIGAKAGNGQLQLDVSTNEIEIRTINGSGYAVQRQNDSGLPHQGGWPNSTGNSTGNDAIAKFGRWLDMGGQTIVNLWDIPATSPWNSLDVYADGRGRLAMNFRSTDRYFLRAFAQRDLNMETYKITGGHFDFIDKTPTECDLSLIHISEPTRPY